MWHLLALCFTAATTVLCTTNVTYIAPQDRKLPDIDVAFACGHWTCPMHLCTTEPTTDIKKQAWAEGLCLMYNAIGNDGGDIIDDPRHPNKDEKLNVWCPASGNNQAWITTFDIWRSPGGVESADYRVRWGGGKDGHTRIWAGNCALVEANIQCDKGKSNTDYLSNIKCANNTVIVERRT